MKLYLDTSVYGGYYDEGMEASVELINWINYNHHVVVYHSNILDDELNNAHESLKYRLLNVSNKILRKKFIYSTPKSIEIAKQYILLDVLPPKSFKDAQHIAVASINKIDYILSWNYKHMVRREQLFTEANKLLNIHQVSIMKPNKFLKEHGSNK